MAKAKMALCRLEKTAETLGLELDMRDAYGLGASCEALILQSIVNGVASRRYASAAAVAEIEQPTQSPSKSAPTNPPVTQTGPRKAFRVSCSPVLSRPPLITRELTSFEKAFYLYQKRLNERLALPFTRYFYFKKSTPQLVEFKRKAKARKAMARDVGVYNAYDEEGWDDEVRVGSRLGEPEDIVAKLIRDAEGKDIVDAEPQGDAETGGEAVSGNAKAGEGGLKPIGDIVIEKPSPRITEADRENDIKSLSRKLDRSLYLLVQDQEGRWRFPQDRIYGRESMYQAAERILLQAAGINMNTWVVGRHPVGHLVQRFSEPQISKILPHKLVATATKEFEQEEHGEKVFFMKARIMAGQADVASSELGVKDFAWLTKEEISEKVHKPYFKAISNMLPQR
ncbi:uncharacterized protein MYCFIDRAFT_203293 [Pseudocercospora fijiensis CIRAD86]|uniref:Large ribosomal subunit protein mL46 n=1 Tax=Pseudocercospora fijiensis (strain CIRAD86) TaxID=383855 RepID=M3A240_PSEFD|nr:uncharacterized protein MYCFIDRAFT_203293 [Pseudocercospora fijiensis CIRAD86]EME85234.1 hypothetical protein MYCFIDRAFT_203293 [Pseudocercospora fijiensis CIRAD86]